MCTIKKLQQLDLNVGDVIEVTLTGTAIPTLTSVIEYNRGKVKLEVPTKCMFCGEELSEPNEQSGVVYCESKLFCKIQLKYFLYRLLVCLKIGKRKELYSKIEFSPENLVDELRNKNITLKISINSFLQAMGVRRVNMNAVHDLEREVLINYNPQTEPLDVLVEEATKLLDCLPTIYPIGYENTLKNVISYVKGGYTEYLLRQLFTNRLIDFYAKPKFRQ